MLGREHRSLRRSRLVRRPGLAGATCVPNLHVRHTRTMEKQEDENIVTAGGSALVAKQCKFPVAGPTKLFIMVPMVMFTTSFILDPVPTGPK